MENLRAAMLARLLAPPAFLTKRHTLLRLTTLAPSKLGLVLVFDVTHHVSQRNCSRVTEHEHTVRLLRTAEFGVLIFVDQSVQFLFHKFLNLTRDLSRWSVVVFESLFTLLCRINNFDTLHTSVLQETWQTFPSIRLADLRVALYGV